MAAKTQICKVTHNNKACFFKGSTALYTTANTGLTGIEPAAATDKDEPLYDTAELMRVGALQPIAVRCQLGSGKFVTYRLLTASTNTLTAIGDINAGGKTLNGNPALSATIARRRVMR